VEAGDDDEVAADGAELLMRRILAIAVLALLAAGCGGSGGASASPADIAQAAKKTASSGSFEADFGISATGLSGKGSGVFNTGKHSSGQLNMTVTASGRQLPVDTVVTGDVFYMRSPAFAQSLSQGKQWIKVDLAKLAQQRGVDLGGLLNASPTPTNALAYLAGTETVQKVGTETVGGVETTHYKVSVDIQRAADKATGSARTSLESVIAQTGLKKLPLDVWVDGNGYIRKVIYEEHASRRQAAKVTMELHDFAGHTAIAPPPADSVVDLTKLGAGG
jgi:outer membrane lipoprotein-sorting protein